MSYVELAITEGFLPSGQYRERDTSYVNLSHKDIEIPFVIPTIAGATEMSHRLFVDSTIGDALSAASHVYLYVAPPGTVCYIPGSTPAQSGDDVVIYAMDLGSLTEQQILVLGGPMYSMDLFLGSFMTYLVPELLLIEENKYIFFDFLNQKPSAPYDRSTLLFAKQSGNLSITPYATNKNGVEIRGTLNLADLNSRIEGLTLDLTDLKTVSTYVARDSLTLHKNSLVLVGDASGDPNINTGYAVYFWDNNTSTWTLTYASEDEGISVDFSMLGFASTAAQIDTAASWEHTHGNTVLIDNIQTNPVTNNLVYNNIELQEGMLFSVVEF
jgi:hypothetical protein